MVWFAALPLVIWLYLLLCRGGFWRARVRLPIAAVPSSWPSVAVIVPARNEALVLSSSLPSLLAQDYPGPLQIVLVDDQSSDGTAQIARGLAARQVAGCPSRCWRVLSLRRAGPASLGLSPRGCWRSRRGCSLSPEVVFVRFPSSYS